MNGERGPGVKSTATAKDKAEISLGIDERDEGDLLYAVSTDQERAKAQERRSRRAWRHSDDNVTHVTNGSQPQQDSETASTTQRLRHSPTLPYRKHANGHNQHYHP